MRNFCLKPGAFIPVVCVVAFGLCIIISRSTMEYKGDVWNHLLSMSFSQNDISSFGTWMVPTRKGNLTYQEIFDTLYKPFGYELCNEQPSEFWPRLKKTVDCKKVFENYLTNAGKKTVWPPPKEIPSEMLNAYTCNGLIAVNSWYIAEQQNMADKKSINWTKEMIDSMIPGVIKGHGFPYPNDAQRIIDALKDFPPLGRGYVIGSQSPWLEALCIAFGSKHITTVEYLPINSTDPRITLQHPDDFSKNWERGSGKDFAVSFSSLEHSGLGRYGDPLDPYGDLLEMEKLSCVVKDNGFMYLGVPTSTDLLHWNAAHLYGLIRYPMMTANWEVVAAFASPFKNIRSSVLVNDHTGYFQPFVILRNKRNQAC